jgi:aqualysin 1
MGIRTRHRPQFAPSLPLAAAAIVLAVCVLPSYAQGGRQVDGIRRSHRPVPGRYIVAVRENDEPGALARSVEQLSRGRVRQVYRHGFRGFTVETSEANARSLVADPGVAYVEQDAVIEAIGLQSLEEHDSWGLDRIDQRTIQRDGVSAYDAAYRYSAVGSGVHVYVLDTGIRTTHVEFGGRAFTELDVMRDGQGEGDCHGHGTHVAGTIGGARFGVAKNATLHSARIFGCDGYGWVSGLVEAIDWVTANHAKPAVINMSVGAGPSQAFNDAVQGASNAGITIVGSAGNDNGDSCSSLMGGVPAILVVGASGHEDWREGYSNYGKCLDLFAPGGGISSASANDDVSWTWMSGTSMAAPHVAGAAALYLEHKPMAPPAQVAAAIMGGATAGVISDAGADSPNRLLFTAHLGDTTPPVLALLEPLPGSTVMRTQAVRVSATDDVELDRVIFFACRSQLGTDSVGPHEVAWDSTTSPDGPCSVEAHAYDLAGNVTKAHRSVIVQNSRDHTPPAMSLSVQGGSMRPPNGALVPVTFVGSVSDGVSAINTVTYAVADEYGREQPSGTAVVTNGRFQITVYLEARRRGTDRDGRRYALSVAASDFAGNRTSVTADAIVLHDSR